MENWLINNFKCEHMETAFGSPIQKPKGMIVLKIFTLLCEYKRYLYKNKDLVF